MRSLGTVRIDIMGDVAIKYRLLPESPDADMEDLKQKIGTALPEGARIANLSMKPFAFGLNAIEVVVVVRDEAGISDRTEESLSSISGIQSIETLEMSLL